LLQTSRFGCCRSLFSSPFSSRFALLLLFSSFGFRLFTISFSLGTFPLFLSLQS
jgi:hypothetical protein